MRRLPKMRAEVTDAVEKFERGEIGAKCILKAISDLEEFMSKNERDPRVIVLGRMVMDLQLALQRKEEAEFEEIEEKILEEEYASSSRRRPNTILPSQDLLSPSQRAGIMANVAWLSSTAHCELNSEEIKNREAADVVKFTIKLSKEEYFEVVRRRDILRAKKAREDKKIRKNRDPKLQPSAYLRETPYEDGFVRNEIGTAREIQRANWVATVDFKT